MSMYPSYEQLMSQGPKKELFRARRSLRSTFSKVAMLIISSLFVLIINIFFEGYLRLSSVWAALPDLPLRWLALFPTYYILSILRDHYDVEYVFGADGVTQYKGRLSLLKKVPYVKYSDINALRVHMDPWGRVFNYGNIDLDTAADDGVEMMIQGVACPQELCNLLEELRRQSQIREFGPA